MKKNLFLISTGILATFLIIIMTGYYPVAVVNGTPVYFRDWGLLQEAQKKYANAQAKSVGVKAFDFSSPDNKDIANSIKQDSLNSLIEDKVIQKNGDAVIPQFQELSGKRLEDAINGSGNLDKAVMTVYNLGFSDFKNLILMPQSRRDVLRVVLAGQGKNFDEWLKDAKNKAEVKLYFVPYRWDGEQIR